MGFDISKFDTASFENRTATIKVPELHNFFDEEDKKEWIVRGLNADELAIINEAVSTNKNIEGVISAITSNVSSDKVNAVKEIIGIQTDTVPDDLVRRFEMLTRGSVEPKIDHNISVKLGKSFPTTLFKLTNKIIELTGQGQLGK